MMQKAEVTEVVLSAHDSVSAKRVAMRGAIILMFLMFLIELSLPPNTVLKTLVHHVCA